MKKILVSLLCAVMVMIFMPSMAFATDQQMPSDAENNQPQAGIENEQPQAEEGGGVSSGTEDGTSGETSNEGAVVLTQGEKQFGSFNTVKEAFGKIEDYNNKTNKVEYVITLQKNIQEDIVIPVKKKIAIDLNGHKITNVSSHTIYNNSTNIRVIDKVGGGVVDNTTHGKAAVYNNIKSNIKLAGGTFTRSQEASTGDSASGNNSFYVVKNFGTMTVYDGVTVKFSDQNPGLYSSLIGNGWQDAAAAEAGKNGEPKPSDATRKAAVLDILGGKFVGGQITIKNDDYGELTVSGGEIVQPSEGRAAIANNHKAKIKGGTIEAKGKNGQAVYSRHFETDANRGELEITGGTFKSVATVIQAQKGSILNVTAGTFETSNKDSYIFDISENVKSTIKSGTYIGVTADKVANRKDAFVEGYGPQADANGNIIVDVTEEGTVATVIDKDGKVVRYASLDSALKNAPNGSTVKLHKNVKLEKGVSTSEYGVTFDLNGFNIDGKTVKTADGVVYMRTTYGAKPVEGVDSTMRIINSKETGGEIKGTLPVKFNSGNSNNELPGEIGSGVKLVTLDQDADAIMLGTASYLVYSDTTKDYIKNGGFKVTDSKGKEYIFGSYSSATKKSADGVVTLLHNYTGTDKIVSGSKSAILDLGGNTYKHTGKDQIVIDVNYPNVELTIRNGKVETTNEKAHGIRLVGAPYESNMNNRGIILDKVELTVPGAVYGIVTNGTETGNKIVLKNSVLNVKEGYGIYFPSTGSVTIDNSVINAKYTGVQMCAGDLTVKGEKTEINVTGEPVPKEGGDGVIADGAAVSVIEREGYKDFGSVKIENGTFKSADGVKAVKAYTFDQNGNEGEWKAADDVVSVTGGTFSNADGVADFIPSGMELNESGTVVTKSDAEAKIGTAVYKTLEDAVAAAKNGETITLLNSVNLDHQLNITKSITLDGNGNTLKVRIAAIDKMSAGERAAVFVNGADVDVTIKNITLDGPCEDASKWISGAHTLKVWGGAKATLSNATLTHGMEALQVGKNSEAVLDGKINFTKNMYDGIELIDGGDAATTSEDAALTVNKGTEFVNKDTIIWKNSPESSVEKLPVQENITDNSGNLQFDKDGNLTDVEKPYVPPYIPPTPTPQKPTIEAEEGATVTLSKDGTTATITVDKDATLKDVLLNGQSLGAVAEVPNLKTGDKLVVIVETAVEKAERLTKGVENTTIKLYYNKNEIGKGWIKVRYKKSYGYKVDNYEIFRSAKKKTNFGKKAWFVTKTNKTKGFYKNGKSVKKGTRYYYKMRGVREIDGKKVYTKWSNVVMRTGR